MPSAGSPYEGLQRQEAQIRSTFFALASPAWQPPVSIEPIQFRFQTDIKFAVAIMAESGGPSEGIRGRHPGSRRAYRRG